MLNNLCTRYAVVIIICHFFLVIKIIVNTFFLNTIQYRIRDNPRIRNSRQSLFSLFYFLLYTPSSINRQKVWKLSYSRAQRRFTIKDIFFFNFVLLEMQYAYYTMWNFLNTHGILLFGADELVCNIADAFINIEIYYYVRLRVSFKGEYFELVFLSCKTYLFSLCIWIL